MSEIKDGGPAFPLIGTQWNPDRDEHEVTTTDSGLTLRDYFAGKELEKTAGPLILDEDPHYDRLAEHCYRMADAMLRARGES